MTRELGHQHHGGSDTYVEIWGLRRCYPGRDWGRAFPGAGAAQVKALSQKTAWCGQGITIVDIYWSLTMCPTCSKNFTVLVLLMSTVLWSKIPSALFYEWRNRHREVKYLSQSSTATKWQNQHLDSGHLIRETISFFKKGSPSFIEIYWHITLCAFKVYNVMIWYIDILWHDHHSKVSCHMLHVT